MGLEVGIGIGVGSCCSGSKEKIQCQYDLYYFGVQRFYVFTFLVKKYRVVTFPFDLAANFNWPKPFKDRDQDQPLIYWSITEPSAWSRVTTSRGVSGHISMAFGFNSSPIPGASDIVR